MSTKINKGIKKTKTFPVLRGNKAVYLPLSELTAGELNEMFQNISNVAKDHPKSARQILEEIRDEISKRQYDPFLLENDIEGFIINQLCARQMHIKQNNITVTPKLRKKIESQSKEVQKDIREMILHYHKLIFQ